MTRYYIDIPEILIRFPDSMVVQSTVCVCVCVCDNQL